MKNNLNCLSGELPKTFSLYESTFVEVHAELHRACVWLESAGVLCDKNRISRYKKIFESLARHQLANRLDSFLAEYSFESWANAAYEVDEIIRIYRGLHKISDPSLNNRVKDCMKGHELYVHDTENSSGRDFSFELATAAKFLNAGFKVDFAGEVDLKVEIDGMPLFVECKRLKSAKKVRQRVKDGFDQLHNRYKNSENPSVARGILFISIGKVINKNLGFLRGDSPKNLRDKVLGCLCNFKEKHQDAWRRKLDHRTLAVVIVLDTPGYVYSEKKCYICHQAIVEPLVCSDSNNDIWLNKIFKRGSIF